MVRVVAISGAAALIGTLPNGPNHGGPHSAMALQLKKEAPEVSHQEPPETCTIKPKSLPYAFGIERNVSLALVFFHQLSSTNMNQTMCFRYHKYIESIEHSHDTINIIYRIHRYHKYIEHSNGR